jgi:hypothetical protein
MSTSAGSNSVGPQGIAAAVTRLAERSWRVPLVFAAILFALSGPAHALGRVDAVFYASLGGVTLGGIGVVLGVLTLDINPAVRERSNVDGPDGVEGEEPA